MGSPQLDLGRFDIPDDVLRGAFERCHIDDAMTFEEAMQRPEIKRLMEIEVELREKHHKHRSAA